MRRSIIAIAVAWVLLGGGIGAASAGPSGSHPGCIGIVHAAAHVTGDGSPISATADACDNAPQPPGYDIKKNDGAE